MSETTTQPEWWTPARLAKRWPISKSTIVRLLNAGTLKGKRFGTRWGVHISAVEAFERDGLVAQPAPPLMPDMSEWENLPQYV